MILENPYIEVIAVCVIIIISYFFNLFAKKTNVPSVLMLIFLGIGINYFLKTIDFQLNIDLQGMLNLLGIIGLIMIVLEAALDLKLTKEKQPLILKSFFIAFLGLFACAFSIAWILNEYVIGNFFQAFIYAIPLSIMSSAIIIPSVVNLVDSKKEFMIYEGTFSDILGIMLFYFVMENENSKVVEITGNVSLNIGVTILLSFLVSYILVYILQSIDQKVKLFLLIAVLVLLYSVGKLFHLSSLIVILIFGLILNNYKIFFFGKMRKMVNKIKLAHVLDDFHVVTMESAFVVRTFFFIIFGMTLDLNSLIDLNTALISGGIILVIYVIRYILFKAFQIKSIFPEVLIAPRGLITVLLFFGIPQAYQFEGFNTGILLYIILLTSIIMTFSMLAKGDESEYVAELTFEDWDDLDKEIKELENKSEETKVS